MKSALVLALWLSASAFAAARADEPLAPLEFERGEGKIAISAGGEPIADFVFADPEIPRPYFANLHAPSGTQVSRHHPPREDVDAVDHAQMHPGLWLAFGDVSGADSWRLKSPVEFVEFAEEPAVVDGALRFAARFRYLRSAGGDAIAEELCRVEIRNSRGGYWIDFESSLSPLGEAIVFGDQEEMGLGVRVATEITVKGGGRIENAAGLVDEKGVWGKSSPWCDYRGAIGEHIVGMLIVPHPDNFRPSWFHARDYGVLVANPFGKKAFEGGEPSRVEVYAGDSLRLRFAVLLHSSPKSAVKSDSDASLSFDAAAAYEAIAKSWREAASR